MFILQVSKLDAKLDALSKKVDDLSEMAAGRADFQRTQLINSIMSANDPLRAHSHKPSGEALAVTAAAAPAGVAAAVFVVAAAAAAAPKTVLEQPLTWAHLAVSGSEKIPGGSEFDNANKWTRSKSNNFLSAMDHKISDEASESEDTLPARKARCAVAAIMGVPLARLQSLA